jgi:hypothetical protein
VETDHLEIVLDEPAGRLDAVWAHLTGRETIPALEEQPAFRRDKIDDGR